MSTSVSPDCISGADGLPYFQKSNGEQCILTLHEKQTNRAAVSLLFGLLVVERLVPFVLRLPRVLQDGAEDGLEQQDAQVDDQEGVHGPDTRACSDAKPSITSVKTEF